MNFGFEFEIGYYDKILEKGLIKKGACRLIGTKLLVKNSSFTDEDINHLDYACGPGTFIGNLNIIQLVLIYQIYK